MLKSSVSSSVVAFRCSFSPLDAVSNRTAFFRVPRCRYLLTLAIETSCDDTSVAIVEKKKNATTTIHFLENITADSRQYRGIHPILALESHQRNLAKLVNKAMIYLPVPTGGNVDGDGEDGRSGSGSAELLRLADGDARRKLDFISVTRGPGMRSNLSVGLDTAKALAVAWQIPFVGVHHMQAHLLTPRLVSSSSSSEPRKDETVITPDFPFLSILVSGGHSILVKSSSITEHEIIASSTDIAIGESLDKSARDILPSRILQNAKNTMYGKALEQFAFPNGPADYADYRPPMTRGEEQQQQRVNSYKPESFWGWHITTPFANTRALQFSFSSIASMVSKIVAEKEKSSSSTDKTETMFSDDERIALARESMRVCFEHLASRTIIALETLQRPTTTPKQEQPIKTLVISGGVAANRYLLKILRSFLDVRGFEHVEIIAPPPSLCTDNAAMIGWTGIEMFEKGWRTDLGCRALRRWSLGRRDGDGDDDGNGGIFGPESWVRV